MDMEIFVRGVEDAPRLRAFAQEKLEAALGRYTAHIRHVLVRLEDETGPNQHRVDKVCSIELQLDGGDVRIREVGADFPATIDIALDRMRAALSRQISRDKRGIGEG
jgi:ribosome-associated translation inhibitor RaiA